MPILEAEAAQTGRTPDEALREALSHAGDRLPWRRSAAPAPVNLTKDELMAMMDEIAQRSAAPCGPKVYRRDHRL